MRQGTYRFRFFNSVYVSNKDAKIKMSGQFITTGMFAFLSMTFKKEIENGKNKP